MVDSTTNDPFENDLSWTGVILIANIPGTIPYHTYNKLQTLILQRSFLSWKKEHFTHRFVIAYELNLQMCQLIYELIWTSCTSNWWMKSKVFTKRSLPSAVYQKFPLMIRWCLISCGWLKLYESCDCECVSDCCTNIRV